MSKIAHASSLHSPVSRSVSSERPAVATSVANAPHRRWSNHVSVVVIVDARRDTIAQPHDLGGHEVGVELEPGQLAESRPVLGQTAADVSRSAVLPHDRRSVGFAGRSIPRHDRLTLVGQTDGGQPGRPSVGEGAAAGVDHAVPHRRGIQLDAAVGGRDHLDRRLGRGQHGVAVDDHRLRRRRALIDREDGHRPVTLTIVAPWRSPASPMRRSRSTSSSSPTTRGPSGWPTSRRICRPSVSRWTSCWPSLAEFGPFHVFRPNKDVRFSKDKRPYKDHIGAYGESEGGAGYYVHLGGDGHAGRLGLLRHGLRSTRTVPACRRRRCHGQGARARSARPSSSVA